MSVYPTPISNTVFNVNDFKYTDQEVMRNINKNNIKKLKEINQNLIDGNNDSMINTYDNYNLHYVKLNN